MKVIQPLNDPDEIKAEADETLKEEYVGYYLNQPAPDPLTWQSRTQKAAQDAQSDDAVQAQTTELSQQNDPLKNFE